MQPGKAADKNMRNVFRGHAQLPPESFRAALEEYIQPETLMAKALFAFGLSLWKIKNYVHSVLLFGGFYRFINPILQITAKRWRVLFGHPKNLLQDSKALRDLSGEPAPLKRVSDTRLKLSSFLAKRAKPASFWGLFFLMTGRFSFAFKVFHFRNKRIEPTAQQLYSEALCGFLAKEYEQAFITADQVLMLEPEHTCAAVILARCANKINKKYDAIDILIKRSYSSFNVALAVILLTNLHELDEAASTLMNHIAKFPEDADAAADYLLAINRRDECLRAYDIAFKYNSDRMILFKRAQALPSTFSTSDDLARVFKEIIDSLNNLKTNASDTELVRYYDTSSRIWRWGEMADPLANLHYLGEKDVVMTRTRAECYLANFPELNFHPPHTKSREKVSRRIKIGFFVESLNPHLEQCWGPLFEALSKESFLLILFVPNGETKTTSAKLPHLFACFEQVVEYPFPFSNFFNTSVREYGPKALLMIREVVAAAELDIFYNPFVGNGQIAQFLAYARLAPVQIVDGGRPTSRGMPEIDYFLMHNGDFMGDPNEYFTEKLVILNGYSRHLLQSLENSPIPKAFKRSDFNLPDEITIYCCIQEITRRHPEMDPILATLLNRDPTSLLIITDYGVPGCYDNFIDQMKKNGVANPEERVRIAPNFHEAGKEYFAGYMRLVDANLSYRRMSGGMSFYDLLSLRIPQVVWPHESFVGCTARIYLRMGLENLVADSADDYVEKVFRLAHDPEWKAKMTGVLAGKINEFVKRMSRENEMAELSQFFQDAVERAYDGLPRAHWHGGLFYEHLNAAQLREFALNRNLGLKEKL